MEVGQLFPLRCCCCCCAFSVPVYLFLLLISFAITIGLYTISLVETAGERIYDDRLDRQAAQVADRREMLKSDYYYETQFGRVSRGQSKYTTSRFCFANLFTGN